jgi:hypothetical protein
MDFQIALHQIERRKRFDRSISAGTIRYLAGRHVWCISTGCVGQCCSLGRRDKPNRVHPEQDQLRSYRLSAQALLSALYNQRALTHGQLRGRHGSRVKTGTTTGYVSGEIAGMPNIFIRLRAIFDYITGVLLILLPFAIPSPDQFDEDDWTLSGPSTCRTR